MAEIFQYQTKPFEYKEVTLKGETQYFIEGYISTIDPDLVDDIVTVEGQKDLVAQAVGRTITLDIEHEEWFEEDGGVQNPNNTTDKILNKPKAKAIPVAKIAACKLRPKGAWAKVQLNKHLKSFPTIWNSIKDGFLHSFSIAGYPIKACRKLVGGVERNLIDAYKLINVTLTGSPVNPHATFIPVMKAALLKAMEENIMEANQNNQVQNNVQDTNTESVDNQTLNNEQDNLDPLKVLQDEKAALEQEKKRLIEEKEALRLQLEQANAKPAPVDDNSAQTLDSSGPMSLIKALMGDKKRLESEIASLKAEMAKPIMKSHMSRVINTKLEKQQIGNSPLDSIQ